MKAPIIYLAMMTALLVGCQRVVKEDPSSTPPPSTAVVENPAAQARAEAIRRFPELAKPGSPLNRKFLELYNTEKSKGSQLLTRPDWPVTLAVRADADLSRPPIAARQQ